MCNNDPLMYFTATDQWGKGCDDYSNGWTVARCRWTGVRARTSHTTRLHLFPHKVAIAEHAWQDERSAERLGNPEQRAQVVDAVARLGEMVLDRIT